VSLYGSHVAQRLAQILRDALAGQRLCHVGSRQHDAHRSESVVIGRVLGGGQRFEWGHQRPLRLPGDAAVVARAGHPRLHLHDAHRVWAVAPALEATPGHWLRRGGASDAHVRRSGAGVVRLQWQQLHGARNGHRVGRGHASAAAKLAGFALVASRLVLVKVQRGGVGNRPVRKGRRAGHIRRRAGRLLVRGALRRLVQHEARGVEDVMCGRQLRADLGFQRFRDDQHQTRVIRHVLHQARDEAGGYDAVEVERLAHLHLDDKVPAARAEHALLALRDERGLAHVDLNRQADEVRQYSLHLQNELDARCNGVFSQPLQLSV
jgi:hypothetical protein